MTDSATYSVTLRLHTEGELETKLTRLSERADLADRHIRRMGDGARGAFEAVERGSYGLSRALGDVADRAIDIGMDLAKWGSVAAFGAAVYGVGKLNNELEQTQISLAAIAQAQGYTGTFQGGMQLASDALDKMKRDVKTLPGDLGQLSNIMKMIATPAAQGGATFDQIRQLAGRTMLTATILGVQQDVAGREMAMLLSGRSGAHNILGLRLGLVGEEAKKFNALAPEERLARINTELAKYQGAADRFGQSFVAQWTTLKDNIKYTFFAQATSPLFESVKKSLTEVNAWFDQNQGKVGSWADAIGSRGAEAWQLITREFDLFAPALDHLGHVALQVWDDLVSEAKSLQPYLDKAAEFLSRLSASDIEGFAKALGELKLAAIALGALSNVSGVVGGLLAGFRKYRGAVPLAENAAEGVTAAEDVASGAAAGAAGAALPVFITALSAAAIEAFSIGIFAHLLSASPKSDDEKAQMVHKMSGLGQVILEHDGSIRNNTNAVDAQTAQLQAATAAIANLFLNVDRLRPTPDMPDVSSPSQPMIDAAIAHHLFRLAPNESIGGSGRAPKAPSGGGNTYINEIRINVSSNADPSRVARLVADELHGRAKNPRTSRHAPTYDLGG